MRKNRFKQTQIAHALRQAETVTPVTEVCRAMGISETDLLPLEEEVRSERLNHCCRK